MSGKLGHDKGKHHSKASRARHRHDTTALQQPAAADTHGPAAHASAPSSASVPASPSKSRAIRYPYITSELRRIGILAGIIMIILIVLALVLS